MFLNSAFKSEISSSIKLSKYFAEWDYLASLDTFFNFHFIIIITCSRNHECLGNSIFFFHEPFLLSLSFFTRLIDFTFP